MIFERKAKVGWNINLLFDIIFIFQQNLRWGHYGNSLGEPAHTLEDTEIFKAEQMSFSKKKEILSFLQEIVFFLTVMKFRQ